MDNIWDKLAKKRQEQRVWYHVRRYPKSGVPSDDQLDGTEEYGD